MKRNYATELEELPRTYGATLQSEESNDVKAALLVDRPMVFVGSGGALAVARLAADLHTYTTGHLAAVMTPLEVSTARLNRNTGILLFTARGRNPDAALTVGIARARGTVHIGVISSSARENLPPELTKPGVRVGTIAAPPDGFLATNSVLAMATAICLAYGLRLPKALPSFSVTIYPATRGSVVVVTGSGARAVGVDLEARMVETGLASVQIADYRSLAHGRHVGILRNEQDTTMVAVVDPRSQRIAARTLETLPSTLDVVTLHSSLEWPASVLDQLVGSMRIVAETAKAQRFDPGRPRVAAFGRKLYRLSVRRLIDVPPPHPIERKLGWRVPANESAWNFYQQSLDRWLAEMEETAFGGVVLDYDGTVCTTQDRFGPPEEEVRLQLIKLLQSGVVLGFATGRGRSLHDATKEWMPRRFWPNVHIGLYNGSRLLRLSDEPPMSDGCGDEFAAIVDHLEAVACAHECAFERRLTQLSIWHPAGELSGDKLLSIVRSVLDRQTRVRVKAVSSGHSVDIIAVRTRKTAVVESVSRAARGGVLAIGDQGQVDGNDFELLSARTTSLSVDRCSEDPSRCWNLDQRGEAGPELLVRYLRALRLLKSSARFSWRLA